MSFVETGLGAVHEIRLYNTPVTLVDEPTLVEPAPPAWITPAARELFDSLTSRARADVQRIVAHAVSETIRRYESALDTTRVVPSGGASTMTRRRDDASADVTIDVEAQTHHHAGAATSPPPQRRRCASLACFGLVSFVRACADAVAYARDERRRRRRKQAHLHIAETPSSPPPPPPANMDERRFWMTEMQRRATALARHSATSTLDAGQRIRQRAVEWRFTLLGLLVLDESQPHAVEQFIAFVGSYENFMVTSALRTCVDAIETTLRTRALASADVDGTTLSAVYGG